MTREFSKKTMKRILLIHVSADGEPCLLCAHPIDTRRDVFIGPKYTLKLKRDDLCTPDSNLLDVIEVIEA